MIKLLNINKKFETSTGTLNAVDDVSIQVNKGEIYGIIGFSGAGKSTLLRCINLLERPDTGKVLVDGEDLMLLPRKQLLKKRQEVGMIFQHYNLLGNATVYENVAFPLELSGISGQERKKRILNSLDIVDLTEKTKDYPATLSGGQKQRVSIARAIAMHPKILLCDEPTSALDPQTTDSILHYLKRLNKDMGITVVLVTHEMEAARMVCGCVSVMEKGKLIETIDMKDDNAVPQSRIAKYLFNNGEGI
jgi:ABC-type metal ion transport system, ATPase component